MSYQSEVLRYQIEQMFGGRSTGKSKTIEDWLKENGSKEIKFDDYEKYPKTYGYQSIHGDITIDRPIPKPQKDIADYFDVEEAQVID